MASETGSLDSAIEDEQPASSQWEAKLEIQIVILEEFKRMETCPGANARYPDDLTPLLPFLSILN